MDDSFPTSIEHHVSRDVLVRRLVLDLAVVVKSRIISLLLCQSAACGINRSTYI